MLLACAASGGRVRGSALDSVADGPTRQREASVKPGINEPWRSRNVAPLIRRLESESREIWVQRDHIVQVVAPEPGMIIADIGAGSGFLTLMLAERVGPRGKIYAIDINPTLLDEIRKRAQTKGLNNVETVLAAEDSIPLAPNSIDVVFMCDAYHHFEYPKSTMRSLRAALRETGEIVMVDLERIPGKTDAHMLEHLRAGKDIFRREIIEAGFELVQEHDVPELIENYVLRFRKSRANAGLCQ